MFSATLSVHKMANHQPIGLDAVNLAKLFNMLADCQARTYITLMRMTTPACFAHLLAQAVASLDNIWPCV
jgi:hypothetical protein